MSIQTYCTLTDIESLWAPADLLASVDDDASGDLSTAEEALVTRAIERAAGAMNAYLEPRYTLADLATSVWCRDMNALLAAYFLATRRGADAPLALYMQYRAAFADLVEIAAGRLAIPGARERLDVLPSVSNFRVDLRNSKFNV
jgi:phage gp36-like protein